MKKILILEANPNKDLSLNEEIRDLQNVIRQSRDREEFQIDIGLSVRSTDLQRLMLDCEPDIVHFCGHGTGQDGLVFLDKKISTDAISNLFENFKDHLQCVVLNACYTEVQADEIAKNIKYVVGMNQPIKDKAAIAFSIGFYRALGYKRAIEDAYKLGCNAIQLAIEDGSRDKIAITEEIRKLVPIDNVSETVIAQEHLKPVFYQKKSSRKPDPNRTHFQDVLRAITNGKIVPFLGPGINLCNRQESIDPSHWNSDGIYPPSRSELALYLEKEILGLSFTGVQCPLCDPTRDSLPRGCPIKNDISFTRLLFQYVSQSLELRMGKGDLQDALDKISRHSYTPNKLHQFLAKLSRTLRQKGYETPILIVTANFDSTLELAFKKEEQPFDLVSYVDSEKHFLHQKFRRDDQDQETIVSKYEKLITDPNNYSEINFDAYPVILKLYGPVDRTDYQEENFVITEDHFIDYLAQRPIGQMLPATMLDKLHRNNIWFLGYGLSNWDERVPLRRIWNKKEHDRPWWAIQSNPKALDESLWSKNRVKLINMPLEDYITKLNKLVEQLPHK